MATTIMMPAAIENAVREMCTDAMTQTVAALSERYGFNLDDANRFLSESDLKIVRKRGGSVNSDTSEVKPKSKGKGKTSPTPDKPKRAKTGYLMFCDENRSVIKEQLVDEGSEKPKPQDVIKVLAARWKELSEDERVQWQTKAKALSSNSASEDEELFHDDPASPMKRGAEPKSPTKKTTAKKGRKNSKKNKKDEVDDLVLDDDSD